MIWIRQTAKVICKLGLPIGYTFLQLLFTKDDVIKVIRDLETQLKAAIEEETTTTTAITEEAIREIAENAASSISSEGLDLVEDYDLIMSYREVELDSLTLDESRVAKEIERAITDWFKGNN